MTMTDKLTVDNTIERLEKSLRNNPKSASITEISSCECQDLAQIVGLSPVRADTDTGVAWYRIQDVKRAITRYRIQKETYAKTAEQIEQRLAAVDDDGDNTAYDAPAPAPAPAVKDDAPLDKGGPAFKDEGEPASTSETGLSGLPLDEAVVAKLVENGIETESALRTYVASGGKLTQLNGIGEAKAKAITEALTAAATAAG